eukprot:gb/GECG01002699.1/.p1 GENE.gb/GECG01002699.1/~~gb/GECG01002699.1/.p1  ORF type:complete len:134 (+),score=10.90 gb/GECG01002699.1/:1-402(+)
MLPWLDPAYSICPSESTDVKRFLDSVDPPEAACPRASFFLPKGILCTRSLSLLNCSILCSFETAGADTDKMEGNSSSSSPPPLAAIFNQRCLLLNNHLWLGLPYKSRSQHFHGLMLCESLEENEAIVHSIHRR